MNILLNNAIHYMKCNLAIFIVLTIAGRRPFLNESNPEKFVLLKSLALGGNVEFSTFYDSWKKLKSLQKVQRSKWMISRKKRNKLIHIQEGNKILKQLICGWWNDKFGQNQMGAGVYYHNQSFFLPLHPFSIFLPFIR